MQRLAVCTQTNVLYSQIATNRAWCSVPCLRILWLASQEQTKPHIKWSSFLQCAFHFCSEWWCVVAASSPFDVLAHSFMWTVMCFKWCLGRTFEIYRHWTRAGVRAVATHTHEQPKQLAYVEHVCSLDMSIFSVTYIYLHFSRWIGHNSSPSIQMIHKHNLFGFIFSCCVYDGKRVYRQRTNNIYRLWKYTEWMVRSNNNSQVR